MTSPSWNTGRGSGTVLRCMSTRARMRSSRSLRERCASALVIGSRGPGLETFCWCHKARHTPTGSSHLKGAHFLTITCGREFERFVRAYGRPAERDGLPEPSGPPTPEQAEALTQAARQFGIELVGPPLT